MRNMKDILATYRNGDKLDDDELLALRKKMEVVAEHLSELGEIFVLPGAYARQVASNCADFQRARAQKRQV